MYLEKQNSEWFFLFLKSTKHLFGADWLVALVISIIARYALMNSVTANMLVWKTLTLQKLPQGKDVEEMKE